METEKQLTQEESLQIITNMITKVKGDLKGSAFVFLLWGWLVFIASLSHFILAQYIHDARQSYPWFLMIVGMIGTVWHTRKEKKTERAKTYISEFLKNVWAAFGFAMFVVLCFGQSNSSPTLSMCMVLYGVGLYITGLTINFKPLTMGGYICFLCAIVSFRLEANSAYSLLIIAFAVLSGYIIPGYMLSAANKK